MTTPTRALDTPQVPINDDIAIILVNEPIISALRASIQDNAERGLQVASKWSAELLISIPSIKRPMFHKKSDIGIHDVFFGGDRALEQDEADEIDAARRCMDSRQYLRAEYHARECRSAKGIFLYVYSRFLTSERKAAEQWHRLDGTRYQPPLPHNTSIGELLEFVEGSRDPHLKFLKALFYRRLSRHEDAIQTLIESVSAYPWNWSAWTLLGDCIDTREELANVLSRLTIPLNHPAPLMLHLKIMNDLHSAHPQDLRICDQLLDQDHFPESLWLMTQRAKSLYDLGAFSKAETQFDRIFKIDPERIDNIDVLANMLYCTNKRERLSILAERFAKKDKDRPEICCILGAACSQRMEHEKAVKYFKRATQLDPTCFQGWTLLGFEFMEMANPPAAIEAFRRALDLSKKDYRPWYGMAQAYMVLSMPTYSLYYYSKASQLKSTDIPVWEGLATCYEDLGRPQDAIACYERVLAKLTNFVQIVPIYTKLAKLYRGLEDHAEAVNQHVHIIKLYETERQKLGDNIPEQYMRSMVEVAEYHAKAQDGNLLLAADYLKACSTIPGCPNEVNALLTMVHQRARQTGVSLSEEDGRFSMEHRKMMLKKA
ncbi:anaphase-promoting complex subunit cdc27 [Paramarasmius palmivorus]|uniref:Anaphase-promoting complex subunit cdc27 n=1 Tax=Paramarasmius palmivorus TaxID=297713 RepID=A0AAW0E4L8_9AGAR